MTLASQIRKILHGYGVHSATIQPEFVEDQVDEKYQIERQGEGDDDDDDDDYENSKSFSAIHIHATSSTSASNDVAYVANDNSSSEVI